MERQIIKLDQDNGTLIILLGVYLYVYVLQGYVKFTVLYRLSTCFVQLTYQVQPTSCLYYVPFAADSAAIINHT